LQYDLLFVILILDHFVELIDDFIVRKEF